MTRPLRGAALKALRLACPHASVIELGDGDRVCTACEAVLPPTEDSPDHDPAYWRERMDAQ